MSAPVSDTQAPAASFFGRRKGKRLRAGQEALLEDVLPRLTLPRGDAPLSREDLAGLFGFSTADELVLEIGFGARRASSRIAAGEATKKRVHRLRTLRQRQCEVAQRSGSDSANPAQYPPLGRKGSFVVAPRASGGCVFGDLFCSKSRISGRSAVPQAAVRFRRTISLRSPADSPGAGPPIRLGYRLIISRLGPLAAAMNETRLRWEANGPG